jgi:hypothetical protein
MRRNREAGQTLVLFAVGLTVLMLAAGLSIDMGYLRYQKRRMQAAADAAAIGGASELNYSDWSTAGKQDASYDGFTDGDATGTLVAVNCPPNSGPNMGTGGEACNHQNYVEAIVSQPQPLFFMNIIPGIAKPTISARAVAFSIASCVYTGGGGINTSQYAGMTFDASGCGVKSGGPISLAAPSHTILASYIGSTGPCTAQGVTCHAYDPNNPENGGVSPYPPQTVVPPSDPFSSVSAPPAQTGNCTSIPMNFPNGGTVPAGAVCGNPGGQPVMLGSGNWTFSGGTTFQGPITIADNATVNFGQGTYTFNGLTITGNNVNVNGDPSGVTLYNATNSVTICAAPTVPTNATGCPGNYNNDTINLTAPSSGTYAGILFYQDRGDSSPAIIVGSDSLGVGNTFLEGALYFPDAQLLFGEVTDGTNWQDTYTILEANSLFLVGTINLGSEYPVSLPRNFTIRQPVLVE